MSAITAMTGGFADYLAPRLPVGINLRLHHVSTQPVSCPPLYSAGPGRTEERTWRESHFLTVSQIYHTPDTNEAHAHIIAFGVELLIFTANNLTTVFISKADSTGFLGREQKLPSSTSIVQTVVFAFVEFIIRPRLAGPQLVLSLFARSQNQYLFPGSIENASKHVLDDRQLIKWWCRVLDPLLRKQSDPSSTTQAYVVVPGCDRSETKAFFPPLARTDPPLRQKWIDRYPTELLTSDASLPPRCLVPRLPDDPKARFLDDLDDGQINSEGAWGGVKSLEQFWELMSYRQECSAGRLVGFIWVIFSHASTNSLRVEALDKDLLHSTSSQTGLANGSAGMTDRSPATTNGNTAVGDPTLQQNPVKVVSQPELDKSLAEKLDTSDDVNGTQAVQDKSISTLAPKDHPKPQEEPISWPESTQGQIILSEETYSHLIDFLLDLDFAGASTALESTTFYIEKVKILGEATAFGVDVTGQLVVVTSDTPSQDQPVHPVANVLTAVRKKRKASTAEPTNIKRLESDIVVHTLDTTLLKKKSKN